MSASGVSAAAAADIPKVRIGVLGDSGVGKTTFVHQLCHDECLDNPRWTVGCSADVLLFEHKSRHSTKEFFIEFWDVGGSKKYPRATRSIFLHQLNGLIFMYDLTNRRSYDNIRRWIREVVSRDKERPIEESYLRPGDLLSSTYSNSPLMRPSEPPSSAGGLPNFLGPIYNRTDETRSASTTLGSLPVLVVGNKADLLEDAKVMDELNTLKDFGLESVQLSSLQPLNEQMCDCTPSGSAQMELYLNPHALLESGLRQSKKRMSRRAQLDVFLDKIISRRYFRSEHRRPSSSPLTTQVYSRSTGGFDDSAGALKIGVATGDDDDVDDDDDGGGLGLGATGGGGGGGNDERKGGTTQGGRNLGENTIVLPNFAMLPPAHMKKN